MFMSLEQWQKAHKTPHGTPVTDLTIGVVQKELELGRKVQTSSRYRHVYYLLGSVLKIDRQYMGPNCRQEVETWKKQKDSEIGQYLCPILDFGETWLIMKRVERTITDLMLDTNLNKQKAKLMKKVGKLIDDLHDDNLGILEGRLLVIDYGGYSD